MPQSYRTTVFVALFLASASAVAENCRVIGAPNVQSLFALPEEIQQLLGANLTGIAGVADTTQKFNPTDVVIGQIPMRRFRYATMSEQCALVTVEHGGIAHYFKDQMFELNNGHWQEMKR